jgi:hypothetical protein
VAWNNAATSLGLSAIARAFTDSFEARYAFATSPADFFAMVDPA